MSIWTLVAHWMVYILLPHYLKLANKSLRETAYFTLVRSQLDYASTVWSPWLNKDILELEKVQRQAARFFYNNYDPVYSVTAMLDQLKWQKLDQRIYACSSSSHKVKLISLLIASQHQRP